MSTTNVAGYDLHLDGKKLCDGCEDVFVLASQGFCPECARLNEIFEAKRKADAEKMRTFSDLPARLDAGVVPHAPPPERIANGPFALLLVGAVTSAAFAGWLGFWSLRWVIGFCLRHS